MSEKKIDFTEFRKRRQEKCTFYVKIHLFISVIKRKEGKKGTRRRRGLKKIDEIIQYNKIGTLRKIQTISDASKICRRRAKKKLDT